MIKISALMSVFNGEKYICDTLNSILSQTYDKFELVIIDDGSTDNTVDRIESFNDDRIKLYRLEKNHGVGYALNYGLQYCKGEYIAKVDGDDIYKADRFDIQYTYLDSRTDIDIVCSTTDFFPTNEDAKLSIKYRNLKDIFEKQTNSIISTDQIREYLYDFCCIEHTSTMFRSEVIKKYGYNTKYRINEDYNLFYNLNKDGYKFFKLEEPLVIQRVSDSSTTSLEKKNIFYNLFNIKKEYILNLFQSGDVFIWGAGNYGIQMEKVFKDNNLYISGYIDSNEQKIGNKLSEYKIYSPDIINSASNIKVIVASEPGRLQIAKYLKEKGLRHLKDYVVI